MTAVVGKDLAAYSLPVFLNEPLTILQKTAEVFGFSDLLTKAANHTDPYVRMVYVTTFHAAC